MARSIFQRKMPRNREEWMEHLIQLWDSVDFGCGCCQNQYEGRRNATKFKYIMDKLAAGKRPTKKDFQRYVGGPDEFEPNGHDLSVVEKRG